MRRLIAFLLGFFSGLPLWATFTALRQPPSPSTDTRPHVTAIILVNTGKQETVDAAPQADADSDIVALGKQLDVAADRVIRRRASLSIGLSLLIVPAPVVLFVLTGPHDRLGLIGVLGTMPLAVAVLGASFVALALCFRLPEPHLEDKVMRAIRTGDRLRSGAPNAHIADNRPERLGAAIETINSSKKKLAFWWHAALTADAAGVLLLLFSSGLALSADEYLPDSRSSVLAIVSSTVSKFAVNLYCGIVVNL